MDTFGLRIQRIGSVQERTLVMGSLQGTRNGDGWFKPAEVAALFRRLKLPRASNLPQALKQLEKKQLATQDKHSRSWAITPVGQETVRELLTDLDEEELAAELKGVPGADFGHALHPVVPPTYAPSKWTKRIAEFLESFPFERNVFLMTRFVGPSTDEHDAEDPLGACVPVIRSAVETHGLTLHLASDRQIDDDVLGNVAAHMWACQYGIGLLENRRRKGLNYNVMTEIGAMLMTGRRCALLKDKTAPKLPTDIVGQIYKSLDLGNREEIHHTVHQWVADDLGLGKCVECGE